LAAREEVQFMRLHLSKFRKQKEPVPGIVEIGKEDEQARGR